MRTGRLALASAALVLTLLPGAAHAQDTHKAGIVIGFPSAVGILWGRLRVPLNSGRPPGYGGRWGSDTPIRAKPHVNLPESAPEGPFGRKN